MPFPLRNTLEFRLLHCVEESACEGAVVDVNQSGLAESIEPVMVPAPVA